MPKGEKENIIEFELQEFDPKSDFMDPDTKPLKRWTVKMEIWGGKKPSSVDLRNLLELVGPLKPGEVSTLFTIWTDKEVTKKSQKKLGRISGVPRLDTLRKRIDALEWIGFIRVDRRNIETGGVNHIRIDWPPEKISITNPPEAHTQIIKLKEVVQNCTTGGCKTVLGDGTKADQGEVQERSTGSTKAYSKGVKEGKKKKVSKKRCHHQGDPDEETEDFSSSQSQSAKLIDKKKLPTDSHGEEKKFEKKKKIEKKKSSESFVFQKISTSDLSNWYGNDIPKKYNFHNYMKGEVNLLEYVDPFRKAKPYDKRGPVWFEEELKSFRKVAFDNHWTGFDPPGKGFITMFNRAARAGALCRCGFNPKTPEQRQAEKEEEKRYWAERKRKEEEERLKREEQEQKEQAFKELLHNKHVLNFLQVEGIIRIDVRDQKQDLKDFKDWLKAGMRDGLFSNRDQVIDYCRGRS